MTIKNEEKVRNWENIILRWKQTSLSMTQFCKSENLSIDTFWVRKMLFGVVLVGLVTGWAE